MAKHKQTWNWTPKAYRWRDNLIITLISLGTLALFWYVIWTGWGNG
jgi:hypothetical protein